MFFDHLLPDRDRLDTKISLKQATNLWPKSLFPSLPIVETTDFFLSALAFECIARKKEKEEEEAEGASPLTRLCMYSGLRLNQPPFVRLKCLIKGAGCINRGKKVMGGLVITYFM